MAQHLLIDSGNKICAVILWDGETFWTPPAEYTHVIYTGGVVASAGFTWNGTDPVAPAPAPTSTTTTGKGVGPKVVS